MGHPKRQAFVPRGSKLFSFRMDHFSKGWQNNFDRVASHKRISIPLHSQDWCGTELSHRNIYGQQWQCKISSDTFAIMKLFLDPATKSKMEMVKFEEKYGQDLRGPIWLKLNPCSAGPGYTLPLQTV